MTRTSPTSLARQPDGRQPARVLAVFAHPDDEGFSAGGLFTALHGEGIAVTLICATRGEVGEISDPALATPENLGTVRERELRTAMSILDVTDVRFLGYRDSGMRGTPENEDPRALARAPENEAVAKIVAVIRELRPETVVTFGPDGIYGHPDHVAVYHLTTTAVLTAGNALDHPWRVPALYYATVPRERLMAMANRRRGPLKDAPSEQLATMGTPRSEITTILDVSSDIKRKQAAMLSHRTQFGEGGPFSDLPPAEVTELLGREHFVRVTLPWNGGGQADDDPVARLAAARSPAAT